MSAAVLPTLHNGGGEDYTGEEEERPSSSSSSSEAMIRGSFRVAAAKAGRNLLRRVAPVAVSVAIAAAAIPGPAGAAVSPAATAGTAAAATAAAAVANPIATCPVSAATEMRLMVRLVIAALIGAALGKERSFARHSAGVRTMSLVSMGAAVFTVCSGYGFANFPKVDGTYTHTRNTQTGWYRGFCRHLV